MKLIKSEANDTIFEKVLEINDEIKRLEAQKEALLSPILEAMKEQDIERYECYKYFITYKRSCYNILDQARFKEEHKKLYDSYCTKPIERWTPRISSLLIPNAKKKRKGVA